ncbi:MAG: Hpt domain-containing protein [Oscillospiraceae bacterium]|nr:Hpt domain-containing protein [Oscillospiraceae bacterium]
MTLQECYIQLGGNYDDVIRRLRSERLVTKFVLKFLDDGSCTLLLNSMEEKNYDEAFRAAHTIKGVCQNLSFTRLYEISGKLNEALRNGPTPEVPALVEDVKEEYQKTIDAIRAFKESGGL